MDLTREERHYIIYSNPHGVDFYEVDIMEQNPEDKLRELLDAHGDDYYETDAYVITLVEGNITNVYYLYLPEDQE